MTEYEKEVVEVLKWAQQMNAKDEDAWYPHKDVVEQIREVVKSMPQGMVDEEYIEDSFDEIWSPKVREKDPPVTVLTLEEHNEPYGGDEGGYAMVQIEHGKDFSKRSIEEVARLILIAFVNDCTGCCNAIEYAKVGEHATLIGIDIAQTLHS